MEAVESKLAVINFVFPREKNQVYLEKWWKCFEERNGKLFLPNLSWEVLKLFKFQNTELRFWAKSPQSHSMMTSNGSIESNFCGEVEFDNDFIHFQSQNAKILV